MKRSMGNMEEYMDLDNKLTFVVDESKFLSTSTKKSDSLTAITSTTKL